MPVPTPEENGPMEEYLKVCISTRGHIPPTLKQLEDMLEQAQWKKREIASTLQTIRAALADAMSQTGKGAEGDVCLVGTLHQGKQVFRFRSAGRGVSREFTTTRSSSTNT